MKIVIRDETLTGKVAQEFYLELEASSLTIAELIRSRVFEEVNEFNNNLPKPFKGLIEPRAEELILNPATTTGRDRKADPEEHVKTALKAFDNNGFLVLVNNKQYTDPEAIVSLEAGAMITFIKLVPLIGG
ncbi:hypothetical protein [Chitinophaga sp.]|uniref:hypothetical protein n=1 Tax=Chitinophaga sp. TaxID=1869181 RepID=UPI0031D0C205